MSTHTSTFVRIMSNNTNNQELANSHGNTETISRVSHTPEKSDKCTQADYRLIKEGSNRPYSKIGPTYGFYGSLKHMLLKQSYISMFIKF